MMTRWIPVMKRLFAGKQPTEEYSYRYVVPHLPPVGSGWQSEMHVYNPNVSAINLLVRAIDRVGEAWQTVKEASYALDAKQMQCLTAFIQDWSKDCWLMVSATGTLGGSCTMSPKDQSLATTTVPLSPLKHAPAHLLFPHLPGDDKDFWSGLAVVNPTKRCQLRFSLWTDQNHDVSDLLLPTYKQPVCLPENAKLSARFEGELFRTDADNRVAWVEVESDSPLVGLKVFGRQNQPLAQQDRTMVMSI